MGSLHSHALSMRRSRRVGANGERRCQKELLGSWKLVQIHVEQVPLVLLSHLGAMVIPGLVQLIQSQVDAGPMAWSGEKHNVLDHLLPQNRA